MINFAKNPVFRRIALYFAAFISGGCILYWGNFSYQDIISTERSFTEKIIAQDGSGEVVLSYQKLALELSRAVLEYPNLDFTEESSVLESAKVEIVGGRFFETKVKLEILSSLLNNKLVAENARLDDEEKKGDLEIKIFGADNALISGSSVIISQDNEEKDKKISTDAGMVNFRSYGGKYSVKVSYDGYQDAFVEVEIVPSKKVSVDIILKKKVIAAKPSVSSSTESSAVQSIEGSTYQQVTVDTPRGSFNVRYMSFDLASGRIKMIVDTASDGDCLNDCPVKSLKSYVQDNGGFAGIHGTYFCPTSYPQCAGKTNTFYYKLFNGRLGQKINWENGLGDFHPFLMIDQSGSPRYYNSWAEARDLQMQTGISCRPNLVSSGQVVVTEADLDSEKEKTSKITHGFIGMKGQMIFAGVVYNATVLDSAAAVLALGIENALNIDGGGTTAMYYNGAYKAGPGRDMPNAIVFVRR